MTGFWQRLFAGQETQPETTRKPAPPNSTSSPQVIEDKGASLMPNAEGQAEVLSQFRSGGNPDKIPPDAWQDFWTQKLGVPFRHASRELFARGLLREASPEVKLAASYNLAELKLHAKKMNLKVSGRKAEFAARLVGSGDPELLAEIRKIRVWTCSDEGLEIVEAHREDKKARLHQARLETLKLLRGKKLKEACELVCQYEQAQFFPRGLGVDWFTADEALHQNLKAVFAAQPKFHKRRLGDVSSELRERAAMSVLWGTSDLGSIFPRGEGAEQVELFSRMLEFHASYLRTVKQLKELASDGLAVKCEIHGPDDQNTTCAACLNDKGKVYDLSDAPELPHELCECAIGCRCTALAKLPDES